MEHSPKIKNSAFLILIWVYICGCLFVDVLHGFSVQSLHIDFKISTIYKLILIISMLLYLAVNDRQSFLFLLILFLFLLISPLRLILNGVENVTVYDIPLLMKYLFFFTLMAFLYNVSVKYKKEYETYAVRVLVLNYYIVCVSVLIGYFGLGYHTYESAEIGFKGYFIAGNELSALYILICVFQLCNVWRSTKKIKFIRYSFHSLLVILTGISIATKAALIGALLIPVLTPLLLTISSKRDLSILIFLSCFGLLNIALVFSPYISISMEGVGLIDRAIYFYEQKGLLGMLFSGREVLLESFISSYENMHDYFNVIFGSGHVGLKDVYGKNFIEIDPFDAAMYFGIPFAILFTVVIITIIISSFLWFGQNKYAPLVLLSNFLLFMFALIAGHVWTSSLLVVSWCLVTNLIWVDKEL